MKMTKATRPDKLSKGFTLVEILIVVLIIGLLAVIAWPNFVKSRARAQAGACINNLQKIEGAKAQWAFENRKNNDDIPVMDDLTPFLNHSMTPTCPADGTYRPRRVSKSATCSLIDIGHEIMPLPSGDDPAVD